ncbi:MAG: adenylyltransferase/cytidyltransferase family protein, partial [Pseudomonadota bacterium]
MKRIAFYPGSFDPITNGHIDVLVQSAALFDEIIVGIG